MSRYLCAKALWLVMLLPIGPTQADTFEWTSPVDGNFLDAARWTRTVGLSSPPPRTGDSAVFNEAGTYQVTIASGGILRNDSLSVTAGVVTLRRSSTTEKATYALEDPHSSVVVDNATLTLGTPFYPLEVDGGGEIELDNSGTLEVSSGSSVSVDNIDLGFSGYLHVNTNSHVTANGAIRVGILNSTDPAGRAVMRVATGSSLVARSIRLGRDDGQAGSLNLNNGCQVTAEQFYLNEGAIVNHFGELYIEELLATKGGYNFIEGLLSIESDVLIGASGLRGVQRLESDQTLHVGGQATLGSGEKLLMRGGLLSGGTLLLSPRSVVTAEIYPSTITASLVAPAGSKIDTTMGDLQIGDVTRLDGFYSNGRTEIGANTLTLHDANDAVFDSGAYVQLGADNLPGTLSVLNALSLDTGANVAGHGTINTPDDPSRPLLNNGNITGDSSSQRITLSGYLKGIGTCDFCTITGTDAPGNSTATVNRGSVIYDGALEIEIGGSGYDRINHTLGLGIADLGGTLNVQLLGGYSPTVGDRFDIISGNLVRGAFDEEVLPDLPSPLDWQVEYRDDGVSLLIHATGDFDFDSDVDGADFLTWQRGESPSPQSSSDLQGWQSTYGLGHNPTFGLIAMVPEPSTSIALLLMLLGCTITSYRTQLRCRSDGESRCGGAYP